MPITPRHCEAGVATARNLSAGASGELEGGTSHVQIEAIHKPALVYSTACYPKGGKAAIESRADQSESKRFLPMRAQ